MDQTYMVGSLEHKQASASSVRRGYPEDHELYRQTSSMDLKYPFPQAHLYKPNSAIRTAPVKTFNTYQGDASAPEVHMNDPRYVPQDVMSQVREIDEKRLKGYNGYPLTVPGGQGNMNHGLPTNNSTSTGAGAVLLNNLLHQPRNPLPKKINRLETPIPPFHVQQQIASKDETGVKADSENNIVTKCSRCKKDFTQEVSSLTGGGKGGSEPRLFKLCFHCRALQRQRSRRWQKKTKDKHGACRRCGGEIPPEEQKFVLCPQCRRNLRIRKANRAAQGKCVHCAGPITSSIIKEDGNEEDEENRSLGSFKVCQRCRENDKIRRTNLERMGNCNRCAKALSAADHGKHKVCSTCRKKKKRSASVSSFGAGPGSMASMPTSGSGVTQSSLGPEVLQNLLVPGMNFVPVEQGPMVMPPAMMNGAVGSVGVSMPQEYSMGYGQIQSVPQVPDLYKPTMSYLPQLQPPAEGIQAPFLGFQSGRGNNYGRERN